MFQTKFYSLQISIANNFKCLLFRDESLADFKGLRIQNNGKLSIPEPDETTESVALYVKRFLAPTTQRGIKII